MLERKPTFTHVIRVRLWALLKLIKQHLVRPTLIALVKLFLPQYQDITPFTNKINLLATENQRLQNDYHNSLESSQTKSELLANISHELRTPLTSILGYTNLLLDSSPTPYQKDFLTTIQKSSNSMLALINDILDLAKIEAGKLKLDHIPCDIRDCVDEVLIALAPQAHAKQLELIPLVYADVPGMVLSDPLRFKQILINLISNALKFTEQGSVVIRIMLNAETQTHAELRIDVTDTGIGLSEAHKKQLFQPFSQTSSGKTKLVGTGLGLVICRKLINQMDGEIGVDSEPGKGSTFWFTCLVEKIPDQLETIQESNKLSQFKALIHDPYPLSQLALKHLLTGFGMQITLANDLAQTCALAEANNNYHLIILGTNQITSTKQVLIKTIQQLKRNSHCPVMLFLNTSEPAIFTEMLATGTAFCIAKPPVQKKLYAALCELLLGEKMPISQDYHQKNTSDAQHHVFKGAKALVADDNPANLKLLSLLLEKLGLTVISAKDGIEAVQIACTTALDIILLDLQMPNLNGLDAARQIRTQSQQNKTIPIIAITAHIVGNDQSDTNNVDIDEYLTKPINEVKLITLLNKWLKQITALASPAVEPQKLANNNAIPEISFDWQQCIKLAGGKASLAQTLLKMFYEQLPEFRDKIQQSYNIKDLQTLSEQVHKLHGGCCYCGVPKLKAITSRLESAIKRGEQEAIATLYPALIQEIATVLELIQQSHHMVHEE